MSTNRWVRSSPTGRLFHTARPTPLGRITWAGRHLEALRVRPMRLRRWDTYAAIYVLKGCARFEDQDGVRRDVGPGDLMLAFPGHGYAYQVDPALPWSEFFIQFRGPLFDLWAKEGILTPRCPVVHLEPVELWWKRLEAVIKPLALPEPAQSLRRVCLLQEFLVDALVLPRTRTTPDDGLWLCRAQALLGRNRESFLDWTAVARELGVSYHQFRRKFATLAGVPPARWRAAQVLEHAADLLGTPGLSVKEIAVRCGFCDEFHFSRRFRQFAGVTPAQFRRRLP
jgi:AraC-like DNA-binding protein